MLGNRQLLGGFFVIAFAMGYIVGRYSTPSRKLPSVPSPTVTDPHLGTYWEVRAIARPQAEVFAEVLRDKGFRVLLSRGTKGLARVLVGPYPDGESLVRTKFDLEGSGFQHFILKRE